MSYEFNFMVDGKMYLGLGVTELEAKSSALDDFLAKNSIKSNTIKPKKYTVVAGDTLRIISNKIYGDSSEWRKLYHLNRELLRGNPNLILPGMELLTGL